MAAASEIVESFGGAGYVEDTGLPRLLRDAQVLPIWEGTTNVLSLDVLRAGARDGGFDACAREVAALASATRDADLVASARAAVAAVDHARAWLSRTGTGDPAALEAGARRFTLTLARALELALLARHGQWSRDQEHDGRGAAAALRFARHGVDLIDDDGGDSARELRAASALANDTPLPQPY